MGIIPKILFNKEIKIIGTKINFDGSTSEKINKIFKARVEKYNKQKFSISGDQINYEWIFYVNGDPLIKTDDKIEFDNNKYIVKEINKHFWLDGRIDHTKILVE